MIEQYQGLVLPLVSTGCYCFWELTLVASCDVGTSISLMLTQFRLHSVHDFFPHTLCFHCNRQMLCGTDDFCIMVKSGNFGHQINSDSDLVCFIL